MYSSNATSLRRVESERRFKEEERKKLSTVSLPAHIPSQALPSAKKAIAKMTLWPLVAATFFMVSGGTYGTEAIISGGGYGHGILVLLFLPVLWCLPTAFMIGELSSALPAEGGYYAWVRRGLGNFWGFQEAWLSLAASIFDMAIYPTLFVFYLKQVSPWFGEGNHGVLTGLFVVVTCAALNLAGIRVVGITSLWLFFLLSLPFGLIVLLSSARTGAFAEPHAASAGASIGLLGAVLVAMWNYMGWDNASTIAAVILVSLTYVLPFVAVYFAGTPASAFTEDGSWAAVAGQLGGRIMGFEWLRFMVTIGGMMSAFGMFNALVMSYSRLPLAMARDGMMPRLFGKVTRKNHTPWVAIIVLATCWALCLGLGFKRLVTLDLMLYGAALMLEFVTLVALRIREPKLRREFRVPGGMAGAVTCGMFPLALLILAVVESGSETILGINGLAFGAIIIVAGILLYLATRKVLMPHSSQEALDTAEAA